MDEETRAEYRYLEREARDGIIMWYIDWTSAGKAAKEDIQQYVDPPSTYIRCKRPRPDPLPKKLAKREPTKEELAEVERLKEAQKEAKRLRKMKRANNESSESDGSENEAYDNCQNGNRMARLNQEDMKKMAEKYGDIYNPDEEDEETRWRNKIKIKPEWEWEYPPWNADMKDRFGPIP